MLEPAVKVQYRTYLEKYWVLIAAIAWLGFKDQGRGALVVQKLEHPDEDMVFMPLAKFTDDPLLHDYAAFVREYDPEREVVVIFLRPPCLVSAYKGAMAGGVTPPEAYRRLRHARRGADLRLINRAQAKRSMSVSRQSSFRLAGVRQSGEAVEASTRKEKFRWVMVWWQKMAVIALR